jgi:opacity protein-like surface antigen
MKSTAKGLAALVLGGLGGALIPPEAAAQQGFARHFYLGAGLGQGQGELKQGDFTTQKVEGQLETSLGLAPGSLAGTLGRSTHELDIGGKLFVGYRLNRYLALEGGYATPTLSSHFKVYYTGSGALAGRTLDGKYEVSAWPVTAVGFLPVPYVSGLAVFGKAGAAYTTARYELNTNGLGVTYNTKKSKTNAVFGGGAQYDLSARWAARFDYEWYGDVGDAENTGRVDVHLLTANVLLKF